MKTLSKNKFMMRIFAALAFMAITESSFCQNSDEITTNTAEEVESYTIAVVDGMVCSAGIIKVYDYEVTGKYDKAGKLITKLVAMAYQEYDAAGEPVTIVCREFNIDDTLPDGIYLIYAEEGAIIRLVKNNQ